ncbi:hypothetical protein SAMN05661096_00183 [Marivirga sericea]|uniref:Uncharacterized protein n=1 Tax=Marivirga sericea TaxID=1028 RepID=A0A1X7I4A2_9BACT|nr:DUF6544 family protein [Marivirga sericea]SMG09052.1 hypothetical protein SAMN05661096_00183 [Marivirga sericea]
MRIAFLIIVFIHGLLHILGFLKGVGIYEVKELSLPISKLLAILWLLASFLLLLYGITFLLSTQYAWLVGCIALVLSQILIMLFWNDAKFGTLPNVLILIVCILSYGQFHFHKMTTRESASLLNQNQPSKAKIVTPNEIEALPIPVKTWLQNSGAVGKPFITKGKVIQEAKMKMKPEQEDWMDAKAVQYSTIDTPGFIWIVDVKMNALLNFQGRDQFKNGKGEMLIKLNSLFNVVNEEGKKLDEGTMQRYLGEMVWFPSLALSEYITWEKINDTTALATMDYKGTNASGTFYFNSAGDFVKFATFRFRDNEENSRRFEWILKVDRYKTFEGIKVPSSMSATWKLENRDWTWLRLEIKDLKYNENTVSE